MPTRDINEYLTSGEVEDVKKAGITPDDSLTSFTEVKGITDSLDTRVTAIEALHVSAVHGDSVATSQQPTVVDTPLQVEFGPAVNGPTDDVMIDALGNVTFNKAGKYLPIFEFHYGRSGSTGTSILLMRILLNGVEIGVPRSAKISSADTLVPFSFQGMLTAQAGDILTAQVMRDSAGDNSGGLFQTTPTLVSWIHPAPSASVSIFKV